MSKGLERDKDKSGEVSGEAIALVYTREDNSKRMEKDEYICDIFWIESMSLADRLEAKRRERWEST